MSSHRTPLRALQSLLWFVALSHVVIGAGILLSPAFQRLMALLYGADVDWTGELSYVLRILGVFMLVLGGMGVAAALHPLRNRVLVHGFAVVMVLRVLQRFVLQDEVTALFGIGGGRILFQAVFFLALATTLVVLLRLATGQAPGPPAARSATP